MVNDRQVVAAQRRQPACQQVELVRTEPGVGEHGLGPGPLDLAERLTRVAGDDDVAGALQRAAHHGEHGRVAVDDHDRAARRQLDDRRRVILVDRRASDPIGKSVHRSKSSWGTRGAGCCRLIKPVIAAAYNFFT